MTPSDHELKVQMAYALDARVMPLLAGNQIGDGKGIAILNAWHRGWAEANVAAPL